MDEQQALAFVQASATALGFELDVKRAERIAQHLQRTAGLAALLEAFDLGVEDEPAEVWNPKSPAPGAAA